MRFLGRATLSLMLLASAPVYALESQRAKVKISGDYHTISIELQHEYGSLAPANEETADELQGLVTALQNRGWAEYICAVKSWLMNPTAQQYGKIYLAYEIKDCKCVNGHCPK